MFLPLRSGRRVRVRGEREGELGWGDLFFLLEVAVDGENEGEK